MIHKSKMAAGLAMYIDKELAAQFAGSLKGWGVAMAGGIIAARADRVLDLLAQIPAVRVMGIADGEMVDEELLFATLAAAAQKSSATVELPALGPVTFTSKDVDALRRYTMGG